MTDIAARYQSKPQIRWATQPVTEDNRDEIVAWVVRWGGRARPVPALGTEEALLLDNPMHGELVVRYGDRVMYNEVLGGDFYSNAPETFEKSWEPLSGDASA